MAASLLVAMIVIAATLLAAKSQPPIGKFRKCEPFLEEQRLEARTHFWSGNACKEWHVQTPCRRINRDQNERRFHWLPRVETSAFGSKVTIICRKSWFDVVWLQYILNNLVELFCCFPTYDEKQIGSNDFTFSVSILLLASKQSLLYDPHSSGLWRHRCCEEARQWPDARDRNSTPCHGRCAWLWLLPCDCGFGGRPLNCFITPSWYKTCWVLSLIFLGNDNYVTRSYSWNFIGCCLLSHPILSDWCSETCVWNPGGG